MNDGGMDVDDVSDLQTDGATSEVKELNAAKEVPIYYTSSGRIVYGGGGITPDVIYTPREYTELMRHLERDGLGFSFAVEYLKTNDITENFQTTDAVLNQFYAFLATKEFEYDQEDLTEENVDYIRTMIAREAVNTKFGRTAMYRVVLENDPEIQETIEMMTKNPTLKDLFRYAEQEKSVKKAAVTR
jgi:carboxyl-terminal processing protease